MLKRKLSLEQTWQKCMKMWKEMIEVYWKRGMDGGDLKEIYFDEHPKRKFPENGCYFCDYGDRREGCTSCPGQLVHPRFNCHNESYHYICKPKAFYRKLVALDKKRKKA